MKHTVFILFLCWSKLFSQVGPVDFRCIEIAPNGDAKLTWIPPNDPSNAFYSYEVYVSDQPNGPFAFFGPAITSITTNTFVHTTTVTTAGNLFYYVTTKSGPGGINSVNSETLQSIHLNIIAVTGAVELKIQYNNLREPRLNTSSPTFTINKEYPIGTPGVLAVLPETKYNDTISVCNANINWQVTLMDNSGCISSSNLIKGVYTDTYRPGGPNGPYVDSISVLPDGSTTIAWQIPYDKDIVKYQIYYRSSPTATIAPIVKVPGRTSTSYTFTGNEATTQPIALFVAAIDSCSDDAGVYNVSPVTMFLRAKYNSCAYQTELAWSPYQNIRDGILEYRIYYSSDGVNFTMVNNTKDTTFVHPGTVPGKNVCYFVRVINNSKTITASSNRACFFSTQVSASNYVYIKTATVNNRTNVLLKIHLDVSATSRGFNLFRSDDGTLFSQVGFVPFVNNQPDYTFTDLEAKPGSQSYIYKAVIVDSCGNSRNTSNLTKTIFLKVEDDKENIFAKHLSWNAYEGFGGAVSRYTIYRIINDSPASLPAGTVAANATTFTDDIEDEASLGSKIEYMVEAAEGPGNPYGFFEGSLSNPASVYMEGRIFIPTAFAPKGHNKIWMPVTHFVDKSDYSVSVFNRWGKQVFQTNRDDEGWNGDNCIPDVYVYLVRYKNSLGEYKEIKGTVLMLE